MTQKCNLDHLSKWIMTFNRPRSFEFSVVIVIRIDDPDQQPTTLSTNSTKRSHYFIKTKVIILYFGAIPNRDFKCFKCKAPLNIWLRTRNSASKPFSSWRCSNGKCHGWISFIDNSFFGNFRKPLDTLAKLYTPNEILIFLCSE